MMFSRSNNATPSFSPSHAIELARRNLFGRWGLGAVAVIAIGAGLAFNWSWLVAAGIAPILVATLPCLAMCALGLCMAGMMGREDTGQSAPGTTAEPKLSPSRTGRGIGPAESADQLTMDLGD